MLLCVLISQVWGENHSNQTANIEGTLLMLDDTTPHVAVPVQAISNGKLIDGVLTDESGKYRFVNLKPGWYQVRCYISEEYVYYGKKGKGEGRKAGEILQVERGKTVKNIDFRFPQFKKGTWKNYITLDGLPSMAIHVIYQDHSGMLWFGSGSFSRAKDNGGVSRYDGKKFVNFTTKDGLADNSVWAIHSTPGGVMWFGTYGGGISRYDGKEFKNFTVDYGLAINFVIVIHSSSDGMLWFGTTDGVSRYDGKKFVNFTKKDGLVRNNIKTIHCTPDGVMWFGTYGGVSRYDGKGFINFTTADGLLHSSVETIQHDSNGIVWFGTGFSGAIQYDEKAFINFTTKDGLPDNSVYAIHSGFDGGIWIGTTNGVAHYDGNGIRIPKTFTTKDGLTPKQVSIIHRTPDGTLWFGTGGHRRYYGGVFCYKSNIRNDLSSSFVNVTTKDGLAGNRIYAIHGTSDGMLWFGGTGGISRYDGKEFVNFTTKNELVPYRIHTIYSNPDGVLWFGGKGVLSRYDGKGFKSFNRKDGLADNYVWTIHRDIDGMLWFGTEAGVSRYDGKRFKNFSKKDGLTGNWVWAGCCDLDGVMWFGIYGGGVVGYDGVAWTSLDTRDGLAGDLVFSIELNPDGTLWFGTNGGMTHYSRSDPLPRVRIVSMRTDKWYVENDHRGLFSQVIPPLIAGTRTTIEYSAIDFKTLPEKQQYRVRIKETDSDWRKPTKATFFDYTFKNAGTYTFEVQAIDRDLNYSEPASLTFEVVPPFYLRAGFLIPTVGFGTVLLAISIILAIAFVKHRKRLSAYQQQAVKELQEANQVQMSLMPEVAPPIEGVEIAGRCIPANTVSGDFFDYLEGKHPNEIALVVADVTGKAMKGAMNAVMADGVLRATAMEQEHFTPSSLMMTLNNVLKARMERFMNVTMVIGMIDVAPNSGEFGYTLTLANAGHHAYPILLRNGEIQPIKMGGLPLGMKAGIEYDEEKFHLESRDVLILMTDGIIEAQDSEEQYYSESGRLEETILKFNQDTSAEAMVDEIINDAIHFGGDKTSRDDDITVVVAKVL